DRDADDQTGGGHRRDRGPWEWRGGRGEWRMDILRPRTQRALGFNRGVLDRQVRGDRLPDLMSERSFLRRRLILRNNSGIIDADGSLGLQGRGVEGFRIRLVARHIDWLVDRLEG